MTIILNDSGFTLNMELSIHYLGMVTEIPSFV